MKFKDRHPGPFKARTGSVFDTKTGQYIAYCNRVHHASLLDAEANAKHIAEALNGANWLETSLTRVKGVLVIMETEHVRAAQAEMMYDARKKVEA